MTNAITLKNVGFSYDTRMIFDNVNLTIASNQLVAIVGDNGVGKTTLLKLVLGEQTVQHGEILVFNAPVEQAIQKQQVAYISQDSIAHYKQFPTTVGEILSIHLAYLKRLDRKDYYLHKVDLVEQQNQQLSELSGGQLQRLAIVLALIQEAPLILLDEPTNHIDLRFTQELYVLLRQLVQQDKTVIMVTHHIHQALPFVDTVLEVADCKCQLSSREHFHVKERGCEC